jgi:trehalose 6-phosphate phosphatase
MQEPANAADRASGAIARAVEPLRADPGRAAILTDVDGTVAPIVDRPEDAAVPEVTRELLRELSRRYALVACVSGRPAPEARRIVGLDELTYSGNHGFELLLPGEEEPRPDPSLDGHDRDAREFVDSLSGSDLERAGIRVEDKGAIVALHWRGSDNEGEAENLAREIESAADWKGLVAHRGRKVLEIRPDVPINKGIAVAALIASRPLDAALYAGDDRTDVDAFAGLRTLQGDGALASVVCVAIDSDEAPPEVSAGAELTVPGPGGFVAVLEALAA